MAWAPSARESAGIWQYDNNPPASWRADTVLRYGQTEPMTGGVRSFTPFGGTLQDTYARTRIVRRITHCTITGDTTRAR